MTLKEWMNLKALQILELITYIANIAKKVAFWKQSDKTSNNEHREQSNNASNNERKEEGKNGK